MSSWLVYLGAIAIVVGLYVYLVRRRNAYRPPETSRSPDGQGDVFAPIKCGNAAVFDPRCTPLHSVLKKCVGAKVEGPPIRAIAQKASRPGVIDVYSIDERVLQGGTIQALMYERVSNTSQEFLFVIDEEGVVASIEPVDKMLAPDEMKAANSADLGGEFAKFISPLER